MIEVNSGPPEWEVFHPFEDDPDVSCEIKQLSVDEGLKLTGQFIDGKIEGDIYGDLMKGYFVQYVRNIEGIKINGVMAKRPEDILDPGVKRSAPLHDFYTTVMYRLIKINSITDTETKNSDSSPGADTEKAGVGQEINT
jgi:hypothetical protein